ncbi:MAG: 5'/3'-nucleotidase SurE [Draconibacterium sp.]
MNKRPLILISNDDGVTAKGISVLTEIMKDFGDVVVVAPDSPMSGMSSALTSESPLIVNKISEEKGCVVYSCSGTPADCVKLGFNELLDRKPDFVVGGINHGANSSISVLYSGTMGVALEGCVHGVPSIAFSICNHDVDADFSEATPWIRQIFKRVMDEGIPKYTCLNVNIPKGRIEGVEARRQALGIWNNEMEKRIDPRGREYYWLTGSFVNMEPDAEDTDLNALDNHKISIVPVKIDMTADAFINQIKNWDF